LRPVSLRTPAKANGRVDDVDSKPQNWPDAGGISASDVVTVEADARSGRQKPHCDATQEAPGTQTRDAGPTLRRMFSSKVSGGVTVERGHGGRERLPIAFRLSGREGGSG
jgi:hypothetical protein